MLNNIFLLFPIHLFQNITLLKNKNVYLIEEPRFFTDFKYHKLKIAYHRASMKSYYDYLISNNISVKYIEFSDKINDLYKKLNKKLNKDNKSIETYSLGDNVLEKKLLKSIPLLTINQTLNFLVDKDLINDNLSTKNY